MSSGARTNGRGRSSAALKTKRQHAILSLVGRERLSSQEEIRARLRSLGLEATQSTISRDIDELGLARVHDPDGVRYVVPGESDAPGPIRLLRHLDCPVGALVRAHPAEEEEVLVVPAVEGVVVEVDRVRAVGEPRQAGARPALAHRDRDQPWPGTAEAADLLVEVAGLAVERPVHRVHERHREQLPEREPGQSRVVVDDVEVVLLDLHVGRQRVVSVDPGIAQLARIGWLLHRRHERGLRTRPAAGEEGDVVAGVHQAIGQQRHHELDAAVTGRGYGKPDWSYHCNAHTATLVVCPDARAVDHERERSDWC